MGHALNRPTSEQESHAGSATGTTSLAPAGDLQGVESVRQTLMLFLGERYQFSGKVKRFGLKHSVYRGADPTCMLQNVVLHTGSLAVPIDHAWVQIGKKLAAFNPRLGSQISFNGRVREYEKFSRDSGEYHLDYCIGHLSRFGLVEEGNGETFGKFWQRMQTSGRFVTNKIVARQVDAQGVQVEA